MSCGDTEAKRLQGARKLRKDGENVLGTTKKYVELA